MTHRDVSKPSSTGSGSAFRSDEAYAIELDGRDPLAPIRRRFHLPHRLDGTPVVYLAGNSLGLQPKSARVLVNEELDSWADRAVDGHFEGPRPWFTYHEQSRDATARLVGARPGEVVLMNTLTVNLHLMMVSFFRPSSARFKVLMEESAFPSDTYAVQSQLRWHGIDPHEGILLARPRAGEKTLRTDDIIELIDAQADRLALVLLGGVHYFTGQVLDMARIAGHGRSRGCTLGFDLAHAVGNVPMSLHDWGVDFAVWCNYKYLNGGPGAVAGCFVHERHASQTGMPRFGGWWGNDPSTRFRMHLEADFIPRSTADGWQVSNPPILSLAPVKASLDLMDEVGMPALREKSLKLTGYLLDLLDVLRIRDLEVITPRDPRERGCQVSLVVHDRPRRLLEALHQEGVIGDFREPNVIRVAPVPAYNTFHDVWRFARVLARHAGSDPSAETVLESA